MSGGFDAVVHPPARLQIMAMLAEVQDAEFALLRSATGVSDSVLSKHLAALTEAGYVSLRKATTGGTGADLGGGDASGTCGVPRSRCGAAITGGGHRPDGGGVAFRP